MEEEVRPGTPFVIRGGIDTAWCIQYAEGAKYHVRINPKRAPGDLVYLITACDGSCVRDAPSRFVDAIKRFREENPIRFGGSGNGR